MTNNDKFRHALVVGIFYVRVQRTFPATTTFKLAWRCACDLSKKFPIFLCVDIDAAKLAFFMITSKLSL